jgi:hypothetical protein
MRKSSSVQQFTSLIIILCGALIENQFLTGKNRLLEEQLHTIAESKDAKLLY